MAQFGHGGHCKHIDAVQAQYGRYGAGVNLPKPVSAEEPKATWHVFKVGEKAFVPSEVNEFWTGTGEVVEIYEHAYGGNVVALRMIDGEQKGYRGAFSNNDLMLVTATGEVL